MESVLSLINRKFMHTRNMKMGWRKDYNAEQSFNDRHPQQGIAGEGELEIEYSYTTDHVWKHNRVTLDLSVTIAYRYWSIDTESVDAEYSFVGSVNYLPSDFEQLIRDYLYELPELKGQRINQLTKI